jgi:glucose/arabinose dehydrogenase
MHGRRLRRRALVTGITAVCLASACQASADTKLAPTSTNGNKVEVVATGVKTPTSFAFGDGAVFEGDGGNSNGTPNGGLYALTNGTAVPIPTDPKLVFVAGSQFHDGALYVSGATLGAKGPEFEILALSGWNGSRFSAQKVLYTAPHGFQGFNGLGFGADGRLYVGVDVGLLNNNDHGPASTSPYLYDILSMSPSGGTVSVFASGIRQPWQMAFPSGSDSPFVTDFGQDKGAKNPPDFLLRVKAGQNYGFPGCTWIHASACAGDTKPFRMFSPHTDAGGIAISGNQIYLSEFGYAAPLHAAAVVSLPLAGGAAKTIVKGVPTGDAVIGLGIDDGDIYFGVTIPKHPGIVYRVHI